MHFFPDALVYTYRSLILHMKLWS